MATLGGAGPPPFESAAAMMSFRDKWLEAVLACPATRSAFATAWALGRHLNWRDGRCDPSQERIATMIGLTDKSGVEKHVAKLKRAGFLMVKRRQNTSSNYHLVLPSEPEQFTVPESEGFTAPEPEHITAPNQRDMGVRSRNSGAPESENLASGVVKSGVLTPHGLRLNIDEHSEQVEHTPDGGARLAAPASCSVRSLRSSGAPDDHAHSPTPPSAVSRLNGSTASVAEESIGAPIEARTLDPWTAGNEAAMAGASADDCPHLSNVEDRMAWLDGYYTQAGYPF